MPAESIKRKGTSPYPLPLTRPSIALQNTIRFFLIYTHGKQDIKNVGWVNHPTKNNLRPCKVPINRGTSSINQTFYTLHRVFCSGKTRRVLILSLIHILTYSFVFIFLFKKFFFHSSYVIEIM